MATDIEIEAAAKAMHVREWAGSKVDSAGQPNFDEHERSYWSGHAAAALTAAEQVRASQWPTDEMVTAAELKMPSLGRLQIRSLFETMMDAAPSNNGELKCS